MTQQRVTMVRIYLREGEHLLNKILDLLRDEEHIAGVTVLRGIAGYSDGGAWHTASLIDLALDLPLIVEFFDEPGRVEKVLDLLQQRLPVAHVISWPATQHTLN
jgi:PII-like signaling protein